ncbi:PaaI family thioesterase [Corynebacterium hindlerae]|uniref:PaaI family thioesterase n=1 Tax=Corynebacterium hindlerae TaxID=699041 RepID=A0A7G5FGJ7_9CORY|nr:PaaI family thioesterase [Corynebacterium hindlerae]QMV85738.1 PaaI family thioesterase [Corynebacterium hindlerae]
MNFKEQWDDFYSRVDDVAITLGLYPISGSKEEVRVGMPLSKEVSQPAGMFSAPALFGLADISGTWLAMQQVEPGVFPLAVASSVNVVSNKKEGDAIAVSTIVRAGRSVIVTDTSVISSVDESILAKVVTTYTVPAPKK